MNKGTAIVGFVLCFIAGMGFMWGVDRGSNPGHASKDPSTGGPTDGEAAAGRGVNSGAVKVELYVMSQCPYGVQAENAFQDTVAKFGGDIDFRVEFIGQKTANGDLSSMHGPKEVRGDMVQACAMKYSPKWFDMVLCQNANSREVDTNWEGCAAQVGIDVGKLRTCLEGEEGKQLLSESFDRAKQRNATGSPTIYIGDKPYQGGRRGSDFMRAICNAYSGSKPAVCSNIPESPKVNVMLLSDKRCAECETGRIESQLRSKIANPVVSKLDYGDADGKKLFDAIKPTNLPVAVFDATLDADKESAQAFSRGIRAAGDYKVLSLGGPWNPACADEGGCEIEECKPTLQCRPEEPGKLEVFVMSQCPFGVKGLDAMQEVVDNFKKNDAKLDFQIHFIGDGDAAGLKSMHGQGEVDEDIREACAIKHYAEKAKYLDYIWCRNKAIKDTNWQACATKETGIDADVIQKCFDGEGKDLLAKSFAFSKAAGMSASPTWLVNGKFKFSGVDPETIKTNVCEHNKFGGCENKLSGPPPRPAGGNAQPAGCGG